MWQKLLTEATEDGDKLEIDGKDSDAIPIFCRSVLLKYYFSASELRAPEPRVRLQGAFGHFDKPVASEELYPLRYSTLKLICTLSPVRATNRSRGCIL